MLPTWQRDLETLKNLGLRLAVTLDTHIHADHITAASRLKLETGSAIAHPAVDALTCVDRPVREGEPLRFGSVRLDPLYTPGHTDGHHAYRLGDRVLTGDALLIDGCGRTDFQGGDAATLYLSIHDKLFSLPGETLVYPAHDYEGRRVSNIAQEKQRNPRLGDDKPLQAFVDIMRGMDYPFSLSTKRPDRIAGARMFAPRYGITEEAATGMAAGPLACYLYDIMGRTQANMLIEQGYLMSPPSPSAIHVKLELFDGRIKGLMAGGSAKSVEVLQVAVPTNL